MWTKIARNTNYSINKDGEVRNDITGRIKKPSTNKKNGYLIIDLYKDNNSKKVPVHRLVAEAFIPNPENKATVDHIDGNRFQSTHPCRVRHEIARLRRLVGNISIHAPV